MATPVLRSIEEFDIASKAAKRTFRIGLKRPAVPLGAQGPLVDRPILIMLDSFGTFGTAAEAVANRTWLAGEIEPAVVVGVGYAVDALAEEHGLRTRDLTPSVDRDMPDFMAAMLGSDQGGADAFLSFLLDELVPEILSRAPESSRERRILFGHSLGGLFAAHVLMTRPQAFETYAISSAMFGWNDFEVMKRLQGFPERLGTNTPRVLVSVAQTEQDAPASAPAGMDLHVLGDYVRKLRAVDAAIEFADALRQHGLQDVRSVVFPDEDHVSVMPAAISRAVTFALKK